MGHMKAKRQGIRLTRKQIYINNDDDKPVLDPPRPHLERAKCHHVACGIIATSKLKGTVCTDLPSRFPFTSGMNNNYIFIMYDFDSNTIQGKPIKSWNASELVQGFELCYNELKTVNITPVLHRLDNEISDKLITSIEKTKMKYQIVTSHNYRQNLAERAIQTYKLFLISNLHGTDRNFPAHLWCRLLDRIKLQVNLIWPSRINPNRSAWDELIPNEFAFNETPLAPLGTKGVIYVPVKARDTSYSNHGKEGWYIGPAWNKYRNYRIYIPATNGVRESNAVEFFPTKCRMPNHTATERITGALEDLSYEFKQLYDGGENTLLEHWTPLNQAIRSLKLNIGTQLEEAANILRESNTTTENDDETVKTSNTKERVNNDIFSKISSIPSTIESWRVNSGQASSQRVK